MSAIKRYIKAQAALIGIESDNVNLGATNQIFPSLPMTEESATAIAEKIQEDVKKGKQI